MTISRRLRIGGSLVVATALVIAAAVVIGKISHSASPELIPHCTAGGFEVDTGQASVAAQMIGEVYKSKIAHPDRAAVLSIAAALQESKLRNIAPGDGDRDSVGVLQQRPSQDWGKLAGKPDTIADRTARLTDVSEATREFLLKLENADRWWTLPAATAIQNVQISADGSLYAQHEPQAEALSRALLGRIPAGLTCTFAAPTEAARTTEVVDKLEHDLGITTPRATTQAIRVPGAGWQTASWFVANADRYGIAKIEFSGRTWSRADGWQKSSAPSTSVLATMAQVG